MTDRETETDSRSNRTTFVQRLIRVGSTDIIRVVVLCVLAGFVLAAFHVNPRRLWVDFFGTIAESWGRFIDFLTHSVGWAIEYFLLGAILVIPIWIVFRVLGALRRS
ncbi:hypothetical protein AWH62_02125 [Maricaulis sp. W15]|uniref:DUF6460 domain-containing protein n=1 Tax=Maricaulis maris TaxID=74318 RepID=A0A495DLU4_9PROT|nr:MULTISPECIES: DUF6460 domain-containing protein [Maricaulis]OLF81490.1 hypothetical protein AWH62_02125 [Maricaulis sp. W15]RKR03893.1 hypothetical protein C7435_0336 [Maricaulis maris]